MEEPREFTDVQGRRWLRTGYCCQCGECCEGNPFVTGPAKAEGMCPIFKWLAPGLGECTDRHNDYYLKACRHWPSKPIHIANRPRCTYKFARIDE